MESRNHILTAAFAAALTVFTPGLGRAADPQMPPPPPSPQPSPWRHTGDGVMTKDVAFLTVDVFAVGHDMRCLPEHKSRADVIAVDCDKRFTWLALRDVDKDTIHESLRKAYRGVDYNTKSKIDRAISVFTADLEKGSRVTISYDAATKSTTFRQSGGGKTAIEGYDFMKATWSVLFGPGARALGDDLIRRL